MDDKNVLAKRLDALKAENFQRLSAHCAEAYKKTFGDKPKDEPWMYLVSEYGATGEGETFCLMITQASPESEAEFNGANTQEFRAVRKFHEYCGTWMLHGLRFLNRETFFAEYGQFIPPIVAKLQNAQCTKEFHTSIHYNFA